MPWKETRPIEERLQFVRDALSDRFTMSELCARYGVSRRIGYKWLARFAEDGRRGLHAVEHRANVGRPRMATVLSPEMLKAGHP